MNQRETEVLQILWKARRPMSLPDILKVDTNLVKSTVASVLSKLLKEHLIETVGITHSRNTICRTYIPTEKSKQMVLQDLTDDYCNVNGIIPKSDLFAALLDLSNDTQEAQKEIDHLKNMLEEYERKNITTNERESKDG